MCLSVRHLLPLHEPADLQIQATIYIAHVATHRRSTFRAYDVSCKQEDVHWH